MKHSDKNIRNFSIVAHIDSGKSTLSDRLLELTGTVEKSKMREQFLDMMPLERERGITIKLQPCRMLYHPTADSEYILNLIDTPGHVDFSYEVSRSLAAVEGALLLVDASKGIQAQTIGNLELARKQGLKVIPVINKVDLPVARIEEAEKEISALLEISPAEIIKISAKKGVNIEEVLKAIVERIPPPAELPDPESLRALIFDSKYDSYKGVIAFVRVFGGKVKIGDKIYLIQGKAASEVKEVGVFRPDLVPKESLSPGEIGYIATGVKDPARVRVGDTIATFENQAEPLPGYSEPSPMVFLSVYPEDSGNFEELKASLKKLQLNDASLSFEPEIKEGLGRGFQCGFLGLLHAEIVTERLKREFGLDLVLSAPSVSYKAVLENGKEFQIFTPADWPDNSKEVQELWIKLRILTPTGYLGQVMRLLNSIESKHVKRDSLGEEKAELFYEAPYREIVSKNFYDQLKSVSQGFASMSYENLGWRAADLVKMDLLILGKKEEQLSQIVAKKEAFKEGRKIVEKLKEILPRQLFAVPLQAVIGGKVIARETLSAQRKDVIAPLYGGDYTRKRKLLEKQKRGKARRKEIGKLRIPPNIFLEALRSQ